MNIFRCVFLETDLGSGKAVLGAPQYGGGSVRRFDAAAGDVVLKAKWKVWKATGQLTHSDAAFLASRILRHPDLALKVRDELIRRFGFLIVDELQDTGFYLGDCIRSLLSAPEAKGVLVGDPDQAIYEFTGAKPGLFEVFKDLPGAQEFPLAVTRRCCSRVTAAARHLKATSHPFRPADDAQGTAYLLAYKDLVSDVETLYLHLVARGESDIRVITRASETANQLQRRSASQGAQTLNSPALKHFHQAVIYLRQGRNAAALGSARAGLELALFDAEGLTEEELGAKGVRPEDARALAIRAVLMSAQMDFTCTLFEWQTRISSGLVSLIRETGLLPTDGSVEKRLRPQARRNHGDPASIFLPGTKENPRLVVQTVHAVKGETHRVTIFVSKGPSKGVNCPSEDWWPADVDAQEERRIAYVAMTRTRGNLFVCVSAKCRSNLETRKPEFVSAFDCMTIDEFIAKDAATRPPPAPSL